MGELGDGDSGVWVWLRAKLGWLNWEGGLDMPTRRERGVFGASSGEGVSHVVAIVPM